MRRGNISLNAKIYFHALSFPLLYFYPQIASESFELSESKNLNVFHLNFKKVESYEPKTI